MINLFPRFTYPGFLFSNLLNDFGYKNQINDLTDKEIIELMSYEYKINYNVKDLLLICEYYGCSKGMKSKKYTKEDIVNFLVAFETNPSNNDIVCKRKNAWFYISELKNDKIMKKYVLW